MTRPELMSYCASLPYATSDYPFDETTLVYRVGGKIFALIDVTAEPCGVSLKCEPELSCDLRATWPAITPGWHLNKEHWNTLTLDGSLPDELVKSLVDRSRDIVEAGLTAAAREKAGIPAKPGRPAKAEPKRQ
jgi:predicted DNA-binding protein (MmcQ/YjbR family)